MLERPPTVVPANVVPVGTIACPRNSRPGGFAPLLACAPAPPTAANTTVAATAASRRDTTPMRPSLVRSTDDDASLTRVGREYRPSVSGQRTGFFRFDGHRIAFATLGSGPPLVLPAWWVSNVVEDWKVESFRRFMEGLAGGKRVIRYDRLGCGMSDRERPRETLSSTTRSRCSRPSSTTSSSSA